MRVHWASYLLLFVFAFFGTPAVQADVPLAPIVQPADAQMPGPDGIVTVGDTHHLAPIVEPSDVQIQGENEITVGASQPLAPIVHASQLPDQTPGIIVGTSIARADSILGPAPLQADPPAWSPSDASAGDFADDSPSDLWSDDGCACAGAGSSLAGACGTDCCGVAMDCCAPKCGGTFIAFGQFTHMRPRDAEVAYGVPVDGLIGNPAEASLVQVGRVGVVDPDHQPGFRVGVGLALDDCRAVIARYWQLESNTSDNIAVTDDDQIIRSLVSHPSSSSSATGFTLARAHYDIDFDLADIELQHLWRSGCDYEINYAIGARYAKLQQDFQAEFINGEVEQVATDIGFDGGGIRLGLDAQQYAMRRCLYLYGRGAASFLAGQFRGSYFQGQAFDPEVVNTSWAAGRVVTILDFEAGLGWESPGGKLRLTMGYAFSAWLNAVRTDNLIAATQNNRFGDVDDTLSFDGLTTGLELRF